MSLIHTTVFLSGSADDHILNCLLLMRDPAHLHLPAPQAQTFAIYRQTAPSLIQAQRETCATNDNNERLTEQSVCILLWTATQIPVKDAEAFYGTQ